jgi:hypothetical protein
MAQTAFTTASFPLREVVAMQTRLLAIAAVVECIAGVAFVVVPGRIIALLLGAEPHVQGEMIGRVAGVALFALGAACAGAAADTGGAAQAWTVAAITFYNLGAGMLLLLYASGGEARGPVVWAIGALHLVFAGALASHAVRRHAHG